MTRPTIMDLLGLVEQSMSASGEVARRVKKALLAKTLVSAAHELIDVQDQGDTPDEHSMLVRAGIKVGVSQMCLAAVDKVCDDVDTIPAPTVRVRVADVAYVQRQLEQERDTTENMQAKLLCTRALAVIEGLLANVSVEALS